MSISTSSTTSEVDFIEPQTVSDLEFIGEVTFPTGFTFNETEVGGLSGLVFDEANNLFYALSDDRSSINDARFYTLGIDLSDGSLDDGDVEFQDVTTLLNPSSGAFAPLSLDPEGIALTDEGTLFVTSEGDANNLIDPFIAEFAIDGQILSELPIDERFLTSVDQTSGIRNNLAFESLTITPEGDTLFTATENALFQDGEAATVDEGSAVRITQYNLESEEAVGEFVYFTDPITNAPVPEDAFATNGLVELLAIDDAGTFLALERSFSVGVGNNIRLYEFNLDGATDVSELNSLVDESGELIGADEAVEKNLLLDFNDLGITLDNSEAVSFGEVLPDGRQSLIVASDNNFNDAQFTQFLAFAIETEVVEPEPEPLDILLVNDDGFEAEGINAIFDGLVAAGHNVTFVAPRDPQSGVGTLINVENIFQPTEIEEFAENQFFVDGSPVVTTLAALDFILDGEEPDLVISGINEGANIGESIAISSGTVSAATTATRAGIPAIAVSADGEAETLTEAFEVGTEFVLDLIDELQATQGEAPELLPERVGLSVNIPEERSGGVVLTQLDEASNINLGFGEIPESLGGGAGVTFSFNDPISQSEIENPASEGENFLAENITVTPLDGSFVADSSVRESVESRFLTEVELGEVEPLDILLTNDDGFDAEGIEVIFEALTAAGHNVTLVAPAEQQSGTGTALDVDAIFQDTEIVEFAENQFSVDGGVRTTTFAGLDFILEETPDLVISGINEGENIAAGGAVSSGTVSAAVTAILRDVPAIAVSAGIDLTDPEGAATSVAFEEGSEFITEFIAQLQTTQGEDETILPEGTGLSVNIPAIFPEGIDGIQGVAFTEPDELEPFIIDFGEVEGGAGLRFAPFELTDDIEIDPLSEGGQFLSGFITVTALDGNLTAAEEDVLATGDRLENIFVEPPTSDEDISDASPTSDDVIFGTVENDTLLVSGVNNLVFAGTGDDLLDLSASQGNNRIFSSLGNDIIEIGTEVPQADVIADFDLDSDLLRVSGVTFEDLNITSIDNGSAIAINNQEIVTLSAIDASDLNAASFDFV